MDASRRMTRARLIAGAAAAATSVVVLASLPAGAVAGKTHALGQRGQDHGGSTFRHHGSNLLDHGGAVLSSPDVYVIWWGPSSAWSSDVQPKMASFFGGLSGSTYVNTAAQYMRGAHIVVNVSGTAHDSSTPPSSNVSPTDLAAEAQREFPVADSKAIYVVFTSNFPNGGNFCAWHSDAIVNGDVDSVAYMPNTGGVAGCDPGNPYNLTGSQDLRSLANVTAHEFMESVTDPQLSAWYDSSGSEIGDKCAWVFNGAVSIGGIKWQLQMEWSNAVSGCVETTS